MENIKNIKNTKWKKQKATIKHIILSTECILQRNKILKEIQHKIQNRRNYNSVALQRRQVISVDDGQEWKPKKH